MILILPYHVDVPYERRPYASWIMIGVIIAIFFQQLASEFKWGIGIYFPQLQSVQAEDDSAQEDAGLESKIPKHPLDAWILHGWNPQGLIGHMWLHNGFFHLLGNLLFLWLFGNAVCAKVGNKLFPVFYIGFGFAAAATHIIFHGSPMLGASGAIYGLMGMFLVFYPENDTSAVFSFLLIYWRRFSVSSYWLILLRVVLDVWGALKGMGHVAYFAHIGGFAAGVVLAVFLLERKWVKMEDYEKSLLELVGLEKRESKFERDYLDPNFAYLQEQAQEAAATAPGSDVAPSLTADMPVREVVEEPPPVIQQPTEVAAGPQVEAPQGFVRVFCSCGKKVKFPAKYAGRKGQCPQCGKAIVIPKAGGSTAAESAMQGSTIDGMIRFSCRCGKKIRVPSRYSGKTGKCPQCGAKIMIP